MHNFNYNYYWKNCKLTEITLDDGEAAEDRMVWHSHVAQCASACELIKI